MDNSRCPFDFCTSKVHSQQCWSIMDQYYGKKFHGDQFYICPECVSISRGTFRQFFECHRSHLKRGFTKAKLSVMKQGELIL